MAEHEDSVFDALVEEAKSEQNKSKAGLIDQGTIGCCLGGILGLVSLIGFLFLKEFLFPGTTGGSPIMGLLIFAMAIAIGAAAGSLLLPLIMKFGKRKRK